MYDLTIADSSDWAELQGQGLGVIVDPCIYRLGQIFLEGERVADNRRDALWRALKNDLGALVSFFDLISQRTIGSRQLYGYFRYRPKTLTIVWVPE